MNAYKVNLFYQIEYNPSLGDKKNKLNYIRESFIVLSNKNEKELGLYLNEYKSDHFLWIAVEHPVSKWTSAISEIRMAKYVEMAKLAIVPSKSQFLETKSELLQEKQDINREVDEHFHSKYDWADHPHPTLGFARVVKDDKWGVIDSKGDEVIPVEYDSIYPINDLTLIRCIKNNKENDILIKELRVNK